MLARLFQKEDEHLKKLPVAMVKQWHNACSLKRQNKLEKSQRDLRREESI